MMYNTGVYVENIYTSSTDTATVLLLGVMSVSVAAFLTVCILPPSAGYYLPLKPGHCLSSGCMRFGSPYSTPGHTIPRDSHAISNECGAGFISNECATSFFQLLWRCDQTMQ
jgi:hypothetical protein